MKEENVKKPLVRTTVFRRSRPRSVLGAASTLVLVSSAAAFAAPTNTPLKIAGSPEASVKCPVPTLAQCQDPNYLDNDRCGQLQAANKWTCATLIDQAMKQKKAEQGEVLSTVPFNFDAEGVGRVVKAPPDPPSAKQYVPDLYSFTSQQAARDYEVVATGTLTTNKYSEWAANKNVVETCEEYAYEKFLDITEFTRRAAAIREDYFAQVALAYGPGNDPASIGTRHLTSPLLRGRDGRVFGSMLEGTRPKNGFFQIPAHPSLRGLPPVTSGPNLVWALAKAGAGPYLAKIYGQEGTVDNSWAQHKKYAQALIYVPPSTPPNQIALPPQPDDPGGFKALMGTISNEAGPKAKRKRLAKELDELYDLQLKFRALFDDWARLDKRYEGSGWSIDELAPGDGGGNGPNIGWLKAAESQSPPNDKAAPKQTGVVVVKDIAIENPETVARKRVLADMVALMEKADAEGCFETGITPCDWSPKLFAWAVRNTFTDEQDAAFEACQAFTKGSIANVKNLYVPFVDDPAYPQFRCVIESGSTITAKQLEDMMVKVDECRQKRADYLVQKAADEAKAQAEKEREEAKARVAKIPELFDKSTGGYKKPGITKSRDESMGGDKFAMGYSYDFGFLFDAKHEVCKLQLETRGAFNAYAKVFGKRYDIIDALASFSTEEREVKVYAKVAGKNLFTPVDEEWKDYEQKFEWNMTKSVGSGKKSVPIVSTRFIVVVIPVKLEAGVAGEAGLNLGLGVEAHGFDNDGCPSARINGIAEPYVDIDGYLEAGVDAFVASVGLRGSLTIVRASLPFEAGVGVEMLEKAGGPLDPSRFQFFADTRMNLKLTTLSGAVSVYGQLGWCPFCVRGEKELFSFDGPSWNTTLFDQKYKVNLKDLGIALGLEQ